MKNILLLLSLLNAHNLCAQLLVPEFQFKLYVEDGKGNRDSVVMGYDSLADQSVSTWYGAVDMTKIPFDETFELRCGTKGGGEHLSKMCIHYHRYAYCKYGPPHWLSLNFRAAHLPVTISWDQGVFQDDCRAWSLMTRNWSFLFFPNGAFGQSVFALMRNQSSVVLTEDFLTKSETFRTSFSDTLTDGSIGKIYVIFFAISPMPPVNGINNPKEPDIKTYPNPVEEHLFVEIPDFMGDINKVEAFNMHGEPVPIDYTLHNRTIDLLMAGLPSAPYFIRVETDHGTRIAKCFKINQ